jgi:hypothetical protein
MDQARITMRGQYEGAIVAEKSGSRKGDEPNILPQGQKSVTVVMSIEHPFARLITRHQ